MIDRTDNKILSLNIMIDHDIKEINKIKEIIKIHELNQNILRAHIKAGCKNGYIKQKIERQIHNNKIIIRCMAQYIIELRSEMKEMQRHVSSIITNKRKNDTSKK